MCTNKEKQKEIYRELDVGIAGTKLGIPVTTLLASSVPIFTVLLPMNHHHHDHQIHHLIPLKTKPKNLKPLYKIKLTRNSKIADYSTSSFSSQVKLPLHHLLFHTIRAKMQLLPNKYKLKLKPQIQNRTHQPTEPTRKP